MAVKKDWNFVQGDDVSFTFFYQDDAENGLVPADAGIHMALKETPKQVANDAEEEGVLVNVSTGEINFEISSSVTQNLVGKFHYDIKLKYADGKVKTLLFGTFEFSRRVADVGVYVPS